MSTNFKANSTTANVAEFSFDKTGKWCILKFFPNSKGSERDDFAYFSIITAEQIQAFGGIPSICCLNPLDSAPAETKLFNIGHNYKAASFEGAYYKAGTIWSFNHQRTIKQFISDIKKFVPEKEKEIIAFILEKK